jgi:hypothetical protein
VSSATGGGSGAGVATGVGTDLQAADTTRKRTAMSAGLLAGREDPKQPIIPEA